MTLQSINPATGEVVATYPEHGAAEIDEILGAVAAAQRDWAEWSFERRAECMRAAARLLLERRDSYARLMAVEMGKPIEQGRAEIEKCAWGCDYYAAHAAAMLADEPVATDAWESFVTYRPLGVILAIMPWNFPFWQVFRFAAPNLMAGNGAVLKHAANVTGCALAIEALLREAGFPEHLLRVLQVPGSRVEPVIRHRRIAAVTLTGSVEAGRAVAAAAGAAVKKTVLELGGSDPYLILEDADLDAAVNTCATARLINSGQTCIAAKRFVVVEAVREAFEAGLVAAMRARRMGDPLDPATEVGPQARRDLRDALHRQVTESVARGARVLLGGEVPEGPGAFYPPTVLTGVAPGMPAYEEELFGPVASVIAARDEEEAIGIANDSRFGLGAAVFTRDIDRGRRIARDRLQAGSCFVNAFVRSDPRLPFGGIKESGYGRELGLPGIREFVNIKTVYLG
jgi:succinate-semialdehyde dehydrogenase/glutarate-semialdehyde dehydrogenase